MNDTILIIANGPSTLNNEYGNIIDRFPEIARINNYKISGFSNLIGSKTTIWFNGANRKIKVRSNNIPSKVVVFVPYQLLIEKENEVIKRTPERLGLQPSQYELISKEKMEHYETISNIKRPTTGFNCILWSMENYKTVVIHGFDFFIDSRYHYYDSFFIKKILDMGLTNRSKKHDNFSEKKYVEELVKNKIICKLSDFIKEKNNL